MSVLPKYTLSKPIFGYKSSRRVHAARRGSKWAFPLLGAAVLALGCQPDSARANVPGGIIPGSPDVTVTNNGNGTVTLGNGIVSLLIDIAPARLKATTYTYNNNGTPVTSSVLEPPYGSNGNYYYGGFSLGSGSFTYSLAADPATNGKNYADVKLFRTSTSSGEMEVHFSLLRGSPGYYSTATMTHRAQDDAFEVTAWGVVSRVPNTFNWISADAGRHAFYGGRKTGGPQTYDCPKESGVQTGGDLEGEWANKFFTAQNHADQKAWGWSSVGSAGLNVGIWMMTNMDFSDGGPLKRDVTAYGESNLNNSILTGEYDMGSDGFFGAGEVWKKTCGPWFTYYNNVPKTITDPGQAADALFNDALAQNAAEKSFWPYNWFTNPDYVPASGRGTVKGKIQVFDNNNPNPVVGGTWVGVEQQPATPGNYDFQKWLKPYQYWTQVDSGGNFTIPNVIAGSGYTLFAFGPAVAGTLYSQNLNGGSPLLLYNLPWTPFGVTVTGGSTTDVGTVVWENTRVGPTVFELGVPDRRTTEFRHGEDYWAPEKSPQYGFPTPVWGAEVYFPVDFPSGMTYTVGQSRWSTDWNFLIPTLPDTTTVDKYSAKSGTINFNLASAPAAGAAASIYLGFAADAGGKIAVLLNGAVLDSTKGATGTPSALINGFGFNPPYESTSSVHLSDHGPFFDERINFPSSLLHSGTNTITIAQYGGPGKTAFVEPEYMRLELEGFKPTPPASVTAYAGNNRTLVTWPVVPGAIRYNVYRTTTPGSGYVSVAYGKIGTVSGDDHSINTYTDTSAVNGTKYYYIVQSWNPSGGASANSPESAGTTPSSSAPTSAPATPTGFALNGSGHHSVALKWNAVSGASYYSVSRTTLSSDNVGGYNPLRTIVVNDAVTGTAFTDTTPTDGKTYDYSVKAYGPGGSSASSGMVMATPKPPAPASAPSGLTVVLRSGDATVADLSWNPVPGATGYVVYRSTTSGVFNYPGEFLTTTERTKASAGGLAVGTPHYYRVNAVNSGGVSPAATASTP